MNSDFWKYGVWALNQEVENNYALFLVHLKLGLKTACVSSGIKKLRKFLLDVVMPFGGCCLWSQASYIKSNNSVAKT